MHERPAQVAFPALLMLVFATACYAADDDLAPSCQDIVDQFRYDHPLTSGSLLAAVDGKLVDAGEATLKRSGQFQFYYVFQSAGCDDQTCLQEGIISVKTMRLTAFPAPAVVYLSSQNSPREESLPKPRYD